jgi:predicted nucleic acid-binding protein
MNTLNFLDANLWLALLWSRHAHSETARAWFEQAFDDREDHGKGYEDHG